MKILFLPKEIFEILQKKIIYNGYLKKFQHDRIGRTHANMGPGCKATYVGTYLIVCIPISLVSNWI